MSNLELPRLIPAIETDYVISLSERLAALGREAARIMRESGIPGTVILSHTEFYLVRESLKLGGSQRGAARHMGHTYGTISNRIRSYLALDPTLTQDDLLSCEVRQGEVVHGVKAVGSL